MLIVQPEFLFGKDETGLDLFMTLLALFGAFSFALQQAYFHQQAGSVSIIVNLCYSYISHVILGTMMGNFVEYSINLEEVSLFILILWVFLVASSLSSHFFMVLANSLKSTSRVMPLGYSGILVGFAIDIFYF